MHHSSNQGTVRIFLESASLRYGSSSFYCIGSFPLILSCMCVTEFYVLLQIRVRVRHSGAAETTMHPRLLMDKTKDPPASTALPQDARSRHYSMDVHKASRGEHSGNESRQHFTEFHSDLETEFQRRNNVLQQGCKQYDARVALPHMIWRIAFKPVLPGPLTLCIIKKVRLDFA